MTYELGEILTVRDFSNDDLSSYTDSYNGRLAASKKSIKTKRLTRINFSESFIGIKFIHIGLTPVYEETPWLLALEPVKGFSGLGPKLHVPGEFIERTGERIIDLRKLPDVYTKYALESLAVTDSRLATYNTHGRDKMGTFRAVTRKVEWFAENAIHLFLGEADHRGVLTTMWGALNKGSMAKCPHCGHLREHHVVTGSVEENELRWCCPYCNYNSYIGFGSGQNGNVIIQLVSAEK